ncbi:MAG: hypothetical protein ACI9EF_001373, partial [Pseudohongiellaceae bacterium]
GVPMVAGSSIHLPLGGLAANICIAGIPVALEYGSSGLVSATGPLTWDPTVAATSGTRQIFLFN